MIWFPVTLFLASVTILSFLFKLGGCTLQFLQSPHLSFNYSRGTLETPHRGLVKSVKYEIWHLRGWRYGYRIHKKSTQNKMFLCGIIISLNGKRNLKTVVTADILFFQIGSPLRAPLLKFLVCYPTQTVDYFLLQLAGSQMNRLLMVSETLISFSIHMYLRFSASKWASVPLSLRYLRYNSFKKRYRKHPLNT